MSGGVIAMFREFGFFFFVLAIEATDKKMLRQYMSSGCSAGGDMVLFSCVHEYWVLCMCSKLPHHKFSPWVWVSRSCESVPSI